ncbi:MAG: hypothetical protein HYT03_03320 [Candidatus Harrisonbacteria bacterium]|nr:hypothetical protein [Candidatus Harrisonbacteria bacterium]
MDEKACKSLFKKYLELEAKIRSGVQIIKPGQPYKTIIDSRDIDESNRIRNTLKVCLEFLSNEELFEIYTDEVLGPKVREILKERRNLQK